MYVLISLKLNKERFVVSFKWINEANYGRNVSTDHIVFLSKEESKPAKFTLPISKVYTENDGCYFGNIISYHGE